MEEAKPETPDDSAIQQELFPELLSEYRAGKDEMNMVEFPISAIGSRHDPSVKTIPLRIALRIRPAGK